MLLNAQGLGYGVFPVAAVRSRPRPGLHLTDPVAQRGQQHYISPLREHAARHEGLRQPAGCWTAYLAQTAHETNDLNIKLLTGQLSAVFWQFLPPTERQALAPAVEKALWQALRAAAAPRRAEAVFQGLSERRAHPGGAKAPLRHLARRKKRPAW